MTAYRCDLALLAHGVQANMLIELDGERIANVQPAGTSAGNEAIRLSGLVIQGLANTINVPLVLQAYAIYRTEY